MRKYLFAFFARELRMGRGRTDQDIEEIRKIARTASENGLIGVLFAAGLTRSTFSRPNI